MAELMLFKRVSLPLIASIDFYRRANAGCVTPRFHGPRDLRDTDVSRVRDYPIITRATAPRDFHPREIYMGTVA